MLEKEGDERVVIEGKDHHLQSEPLGNLGAVAPRVVGTEEVHGGAGHQCRSDEGVRTRFVIVAIDECGARPNATQRVTRSLGVSRKMRRMSGEFDRSAQ